MKRKTARALTALLSILLIALLLTGCGGSAAPNTATKGDAYYANNAPAEAAVEAPAMYGGEEMQSASLVGNVPANVKMIYTADIELESTEFDAAANALAALTAELGGWYEESRLNNYSRYRSASYTVRLPAAQFEAFCGRVGETATMRSISRAADDVSERYYDVESRLATQRTKLERLQALLAQAEEMEDIITLETAISETELAIENLTGSLRRYDSLVDYATIRVSLNEVYKVTETETAPIGFGARLSAAFREGTEGFVDGLQDLLVDLAEVWLGLLVFLIIVAAVVLILVRRHRKRAGTAKPRRRKDKKVPQETGEPEDK